jgi:hypothetical protein
MTVRARTWVIVLTVVDGLFGFAFLAATASPNASAGGRAVSGVLLLVFVGVGIRLLRVGLVLAPREVVVRDLTSTVRLTRAEVAGLGIQCRFRDRLQRLVVVCTDGRVVTVAWAFARTGNASWRHGAMLAAAGFGPTQPLVVDALRDAGRLRAEEELPVATPDPGLRPETVGRVEPATSWLGWETVFVIVAFALPGLVDAGVILAQHLGGVGDLDEFNLPLPHHPGVSLLLLVLNYLTSALVVPIGLLLLARTGQPPSTLGLTRRRMIRDVPGAVTLLAGTWLVNSVVLVAFSPIIDNKHLTNTTSNSHVPAYFIVYALIVSATTAVNEEVLVNGFFLTRLSQLGWRPWPALGLSLAVRTSYHLYYGVALVATIPFGYLATRSFQKRGTLWRPILAHFLNDAILLTVAVLQS